MSALGAAAAYLPPIVAQVLGETGQFKAEMAGVKSELTGLQAANAKMAAAGKVAFAAMAVAAAGVGYESVKAAMNFDQQMELLHTQAGASQAQVDALKTSVLALAPTVGVGPEKLAEGLYHIASTGQDAKTWMDTLTQAAKLTQIGMADLDTVTYAMSGVMSVGMKDVHNAGDAVAFLNAAVGEGDMRMEQLAAAIGTGVLPAFKTAGLGMNDFTAAIATMADNSVPADEAATRLRMTIALLSAPSGKAVDALKAIGLSQLDASHALTNRDAELAKYGITVSQLAADMNKPDGLLVAVMNLKNHLAGLSTQAQTAVLDKAFGGGRTSGAIETLIQESGKLQQKYDQQGTSAERAAKMQEAWAAQQAQFKQKLNELVAQLQVWGVQIGNFLIPKIEEMVKWLSSATTWLQKHKEIAEIVAVIVGTVLVTAVMAYVVAMTEAAAANIAATWEFLLIIALIALLAVGIYELVKHWSTVWNWIKQITGDVWHWIYQYIWKDGIYKAYSEIFDLLHRFETGWKDTWNNIGNFFQGLYDHTLKPIFDAIGNAMDALKSFDKSAGGAAQSAVSGIMSHLPHFDSGGTVPGPFGAPRLAVVHGGEQVLSLDQIRALGGTAQGGAVSGGAGVGSASGGDTVINQTLTLDGYNLWQGQLRVARRKGINPNQMYPTSTGFLARSA